MFQKIFYSPKKHIEIINREIEDLRKLEHSISPLGDEWGTFITTHPLKESIKRRKHLIKCLIDNYLDEEEDVEFIEFNT